MVSFNIDQCIDWVRNMYPQYTSFLDNLKFKIIQHEDEYDISTSLTFKNTFWVPDVGIYDDQLDLVKYDILNTCDEYQAFLWEHLRPSFSCCDRERLRCRLSDDEFDIVITPFRNCDNFICVSPDTYYKIIHTCEKYPSLLELCK